MNLSALHLLRPLQSRDFRLLWIGQSLSAVGNSFQAVALTWYILQVTGSTIALTIALLSLALPQAALTLIGGAIVDRFDARAILLWSDSVRVVTASLLALITRMGTTHLILLYIILGCHGIVTGICSPASGALLPHVIPPEKLDHANSLTAAVGQLGLLLGVLPAGFLIAHVGPIPAFILNACSYLVAAGCSLFITPLILEQKQERQKPSSLWQDIHEGWTYLKTLPWLVTLVYMDGLLALAATGSNSIGLPELAATLRAGAPGFSLFLWCMGCGTVVGMLLPSLFPFRRHRGLICILFQFGEALLAGTMAIVPLPLAALCLFGWNMLNGAVLVLTLTLIQVHVVRNKLGRVMSFWQLASVGLIPLSQLGAGLVTNMVGVQTLFVLAGCLVMLGSVLGWCAPSLRQLN